jgi:hypothetical protein
MQWPEKKENERHIERNHDKNSSHFTIFGGADEKVDTFDNQRHVGRIYKNRSTVRLDFSDEDRR